MRAEHLSHAQTTKLAEAALLEDSDLKYANDTQLQLFKFQNHIWKRAIYASLSCTVWCGWQLVAQYSSVRTAGVRQKCSGESWKFKYVCSVIECGYHSETELWV